MCSSLCFHSDRTTGLALSSRNAYLTEAERTDVAPVLYAALQTAQRAWDANVPKSECVARALDVIASRQPEFERAGADVRVDYIEMNDPETFDVLPDDAARSTWEADAEGRPVILSAAMWVGKTRLIDNIVLGARHVLGIVG